MSDFILSSRRKIVWDSEPERPTSIAAEVKYQSKRKIQKLEAPPKEDSSALNGHKALKKRELTDADRAVIRREFLRLSGCLSDKDKICSMLCETLNEENRGKPLSVPQVTGYVSVLHRYIAMRTLELTSEQRFKYFKWMEKQYGLWSQYNSDKYRKYRERKPTVPVPATSSPQRKRYVHGVF